MRPPSFRTAWPFALIVGLSPVATDLYLPAIPAIAREFAADMQMVERSISTYFLGLAAGQLLAATASDRLGRKPVIFAGLSLFLLASVAIIFIQDVAQLLGWRLVQGAGGGICLVNAMASVSDLYHERVRAQMFSMIHMIVLTTPLLAPFLGATLVGNFSWRAVFVFLVVYCIVVIAVTTRHLPETVERQAASGAVAAIVMNLVGDYRRVLGRRGAAWFNVCSAFAFGCFYVFLNDAAYVFMGYFGASTAVFPLLFGASIVTMMAGNRINVRLLGRHPPRRIVPWGHAVQVGAALGLLLYVTRWQPGLPVFIGLVALATGANALIVGNTMARYMSLFHANRGAASAVSGMLQFSVGGLLGIAFSFLHDGTPLSMAAGMALAAVISGLATWRIARMEAVSGVLGAG